MVERDRVWFVVLARVSGSGAQLVMITVGLRSHVVAAPGAASRPLFLAATVRRRPLRAPLT
jgi:hypothetical protein